MFRKYQKIENIWNKKFLESIKRSISKDTIFVATEKIDGANLSFIIDSDYNIKIASRSKLLNNKKEQEKFHQVNKLANKYVGQLKCIYDKIHSNVNEDIKVYIYGEYFGGYYLGKSDGVKIKTRVDYIPFNDFIIFDIGYTTDDNSEIIFLNWDQVKQITNECGLKHVPEIGRGTFEEIINISEEFITTIPELYGLENNENNFAEGLVIRTLDNLYIDFGDFKKRIFIKKKSKKFEEIGKKKNIKNDKKLTKKQKEMLEELSKYIEINRIESVLSKGNIDIDKIKNKDAKEIGKLKGLLIKDALVDFSKNVPDYNNLEKEDKKKIQRGIQDIAKEVIDKYIKVIKK